MGISTAARADDAGASDAPILGIWEVQTLNGAFNNPFISSLGQAGTQYLRIGSAHYADGKSQPIAGPNTRNISNRIFNDTNVNVFSERAVTQWGNVWGQFIDHNFGLRQENGTTANIAFNAADPLESFRNDLGVIGFTRSAAAPGTGVSNARQQINTLSSFIDGDAVYGPTDTRLDWLRSGTVDGNPDNNSATLLMPGNYLPRKDARGNAATAPAMAVDGRLLANPNSARVAGDQRANENIALTSTQTLFAREHNRIVAALPSSLSQQDKFQIARAVVIAEIQYVTYNEFLPAMGVSLPAYSGYDEFLDPTEAHEFATVGYRAHSFIHGDVIETTTNISRYSQATLDALEAQGLEVEPDGAGNVTIAAALGVGFMNPDLVNMIQLGPMLKGIGGESEYNNDQMIDNQLRSVLFQVPSVNNPTCLDGPTLPQCFKSVADLAAIDIERGRDHGTGTYNQVRNAFGLASKTSFTAITGESTEAFPAGLGVNSPSCLDIVALFDINGNPTTADADNATKSVKRCTTAAMLKGIYGSVSNLDAFVGMQAEKHLAGAELGELEMAVWKDNFGAARDGDRFFYANDPLQPFIKNNFGIDFHKTLAQIINANSDAAIPAGTNVFKLAPGALTAAKGSAANTADAAPAAATTADPVASDTTRHDKTKSSLAKQQTSVVSPSRSTPRSLRRKRRKGCGTHHRN